MFVNVLVDSRMFRIPVGAGRNSIRWLATLACIRSCCQTYPHNFILPSSVIRHATGEKLRPRTRISDCLEDGEEISVTLDDASNPSKSSWFTNAYGKRAYLCELPIEWVSSTGVIPKSVCGTLTINPLYTSSYPLHLLYTDPSDRMDFNVPLEPVASSKGGYRWIGYLRSPPGVARFHFVSDSDQALLSESLPRSSDGEWHEMTVLLDLPERPRSGIKTMEKFTHRFIATWNAIPYREKYLPYKSALSRVFPELESIYEEFSKIGNSGRDQSVEVQDMYFLLHEEGQTPEEFLRKSSVAGMENKGSLVPFSGFMEFIVDGLARGVSLEILVERGRKMSCLIRSVFASGDPLSVISRLHRLQETCTDRSNGNPYPGRFHGSFILAVWEASKITISPEIVGYSFLEFLGMMASILGIDHGEEWLGKLDALTHALGGTGLA